MAQIFYGRRVARFEKNTHEDVYRLRRNEA